MARPCLFSDVRVSDQEIVQATLVQPEYTALIAVSETARQKPVGLAPPDGRGARTASPEDKLAAYL